MLTSLSLEFLSQLAAGISKQFGPNCEVVIHDLTQGITDSTIAMIENGHVTGRRAGDGPTQLVLDALRGDPANLHDQLSYLSKTPDGKILKCSTIYIRDEKGTPVGIFGINYDITLLLAAQDGISAFIAMEQAEREPQRTTTSVTALLEDLIEQSVQLVGKPVALMSKEDKVKAIRFLNETGAFLITKSGDKVCKFFGISKYTLYSYLDETKNS